jgi:outer membrane lipoprotein-sorting protein
MKLYFHYILFLIASADLCAQQDPEAKKILDRVAEKTKNCQTIQADLELVIENRRDGQVTKNVGVVKIKGDKYYLESTGSKVYFDGKTLWSYMEDINELTITEPDSTDDDFMENPSKIFTFYNRDFKYRLVGEARLDEGWMYEIDLFPINLDQPYSRFKVFVHRDTNELFMVTAVSKDGVDYSVYLKKIKYNIPLSDDLFTFKPENFKGIEVNDMRF